jgi:hypothetical protein
MTLFSIEDLKNQAERTNTLFFQDSDDTIRLVYKLMALEYTEMYFGCRDKGFRKYYN